MGRGKGNVELVELFLQHGADANFCTFPQEGPALVRAVKTGKQRLVEMLLPKSNRITATRALCHAIEQVDMVIATTLLKRGVLPNFEPSDLSPPVIPTYDGGCSFVDLPHNLGPRLEAKDFTPPLVRAVRLGNASLVRLLLAHGADPNAPYHALDVPIRHKPWEELPPPIHFTCGRAVQLAKELGYDEVVQLLLEGGADVSLSPPVWAVPGHNCPLIPRSVYLRVTVGLEELAAARGGTEADV
jgi:serum/glucocorticoid-regulated kinase 2